MNAAFEKKLALVRGASDECWIWPWEINFKGYGRFRFSDRRRVMAHRIVYEMFVGDIPEGLVVDHLCRTRNCVNPDHLRVTTNRENILCGVSSSAINAAKTHCKRGHAFNETNTRISAKGGRICRACANLRNHKKKATPLVVSPVPSVEARRSSHSLRPAGTP